MEELEPITDTDLETMRPMVRRLVVQRLQALWSAAEPHVTGEEPNPSAAMMELGLKATRDLAAIFKVTTVAAGDPEPDPTVAVTRDRQMVLESMRQLEARSQG